MPRWLLGLAVLAAWSSAMAWRIQRDCLPLWRTGGSTSYRGLLEGKLPRRERFLLSIRGREVGQLATSATREPDGTIALRQQVVLDAPALKRTWPILAVLGGSLDLDGSIAFRLKLVLSQAYALTGFSLSGNLGSTPFRGSGIVTSKGLEGTISVGQVGRETVHLVALPLDPSKPLAMGFSPIEAAPDLPVGSAWDVRILNPLTGQLETLRARVDGVDTMFLGERKLLARRILLAHPLGQSTVWVDREGRVLRQSMLGMDAVRIDGGTALEDDP